MKRIAQFLVLVVTLSATAMLAQGADEPDAGIGDAEILEVFRHLYRWYLDESQLSEFTPSTEIEVFIREVQVEADEDDHSRFVDLLVPVLGMEVSLKKADYLLPKLGLTVRNKGYRIVRVDSVDGEPYGWEGAETRTFVFSEVAEMLYATRGDREYASTAVRQKLGDALSDSLGLDKEQIKREDQLFYIAPISPVSNQLWAFWENEKKLVAFSSDADYDSDAFWALQAPTVQVFDLEKDVVSSVVEVGGSFAYINKDWAGRVLFNCVVYGQRLISEAADPE